MRYAIFSDIQGNRHAWEAVVEDMKRQRLEWTVCLGDVVGCGPSPLEVLRSVRAETDNLIMGDCDAAMAGLLDDGALEAGMRPMIEWTRSRLDKESLDFLASMPPAIKTEQLLFTHAEAEDVSRFDCIDSVEKARENFASSEHHVTFVGHGDHSAVFVLNEDGTVEDLPARNCQLLAGKRYIINVGSVGTPPRANDFQARYVVYDTDTQDLFFRSVPFDAEACLGEWTAAGLPLPSWMSHQEDGPPMESPAPTPPSSPRPNWALVTLLSVVSVLAVAVFAVVGVMVVLKFRRAATNPEPLADHPSGQATVPETPDSPVPPEGEPAKDEPDGSETAATDPPPADPTPPVPAPEPEPPTIAVVQQPEPTPPPSGPAPIPPVPENAAAATPLNQGILFYAPLDESETEFTARDLVGGRDLDATGGLPGVLGRVGFACSLEKQNSSDALVSEAKPLSAMKAVTISFWIRRPDPVDTDETGTKTVPTEPPMNLVSLKDYCDVRLENNQVMANMDRKDDAARVGFPQDFDWHHVLVENGGGKTSIWLDHRSQSNIVGEKLAAPPETGVAVQIGSKGAHFHVDEVAIWNRIFTPDERQILYRNGRLDTPVLTPPKLVAHWAFDDKSQSRLFADTTGDHPLGAFKSWSPQAGITPDPVPLTVKSNAQAAQVWQLSEHPENAGSFQMKADAPFTYEGWMKLGPGSAVLLGGIVPEAGADARGGWRLHVRPREGVTGDLAFTYQSGPVTVEASAKAIPIYFDRPHHFAAVWNPLATPAHGTMTLHLDNKLVATATVPLSDIGTPSEAPFRIGATKAPVVLDEVRFTVGVLKPAEFLTAGLDPSKTGGGVATPGTPPKDETPMERRTREAKERRERDDAKREARRLEEEAKRNRGKP